MNRSLRKGWKLAGDGRSRHLINGKLYGELRPGQVLPHQLNDGELLNCKPHTARAGKLLLIQELGGWPPSPAATGLGSVRMVGMPSLDGSRLRPPAPRDWPSATIA